MNQIADSITLIASGQLALAIILLFKHCRHNPSISLFCALLICSLLYLLGHVFVPTPEQLAWYWLGFVAGNALPGVFWLTSLSLFHDENDIHRRHFLLASMTLVIPLFKVFAIATLPALSFFWSWFSLLGMGLELALISHAMWVAIKYWRDDLVEQRRIIRALLIAFTGVYLLLVIVVEQILNWSTVWLELVKSGLLFVLISSINYWLFQLRAQSLFVANEPRTLSSLKASSHEAQLLKRAMEVDKLYRQEGMTIAKLAKFLSVQEYKLRQVINGELGYRNFNDFLNNYRIDEISQKLSGEQPVNLPVLTLALDSGFRSLSSFNKAFKAIHGITPTEYRKSQAANQLTKN